MMTPAIVQQNGENTFAGKLLREYSMSDGIKHVMSLGQATIKHFTAIYALYCLCTCIHVHVHGPLLV